MFGLWKIEIYANVKAFVVKEIVRIYLVVLNCMDADIVLRHISTAWGLNSSTLLVSFIVFSPLPSLVNRVLIQKEKKK